MAQLIRTTPMLSEHQVLLVFMDCFGKRHDVYLSMTGGPTKDAKVASTLSAMEADEAKIKANAEAYGIDLTQSLADGAALIAAALEEES